jgi:hypothetical protein
MTTSDTPQGTGIHEAASQIEALLTGQPDNQDAPETEQEAPAENAETAELETAEADQADDVTEDAASDDTDEEGDQADEEAQDDEEQEPIYTVKLDGTEVEVPVSELVKGYQRQQDYTQKTMALAEERKTLTQEFEAARAERVQYLQGLQALEQNLSALQPQRPDFDRLFQENPIEAARMKYEWDKYEQSVGAINAERQRVAQMEEMAQAQHVAALVEQNRERLLNERLPEWKDAAKAKRDRDAIRNTLTSEGFTPEELDQLYDDRMVKIAWKAAQYDLMQQQRKAIKPTPQQGPAPVRSGSQNFAPRQVTEVTRAKQRLAKTGSLQDAAAAIAKML